MATSEVRITRRDGRTHVDYGDRHGARFVVSPMEEALAAEVIRLKGVGRGQVDDVRTRKAVTAANRRAVTAERDAEQALEHLEECRRSMGRAAADADALQCALIALIEACADSPDALADALADARELLDELGEPAVALRERAA